LPAASSVGKCPRVLMIFRSLAAGVFDVGVRPGQFIAADMVAVRLMPPFPVVVVGSPDYLRRRKQPKSIDDLRGHACLHMLRSNGSIASWPFVNGNKAVEAIVSRPLIAYDREKTSNTNRFRLAGERCGLITGIGGAAMAPRTNHVKCIIAVRNRDAAATRHPERLVVRGTASRYPEPAGRESKDLPCSAGIRRVGCEQCVRAVRSHRMELACIALNRAVERDE
jgi:hypothetical protein